MHIFRYSLVRNAVGLRRRPGALFGASLVLLGVERFIAEFWRITPRVAWMDVSGATFQYRGVHYRYCAHSLDAHPSPYKRKAK